MASSDARVTEQVTLDTLNPLDIANERKLEGNDRFRQGDWNGAIAAYRSALNVLPASKGKARADTSPPPSTPPPDENDDDSGSPSRPEQPPQSSTTTRESIPIEQEKDEVEADTEVLSPAVSRHENECRKLRAVLHANVGACFVKLGDHKAAVEACSEALVDDPAYVKALERRAASNEVLDTWSSLTGAQEDYNTLMRLVTTSSQTAEIERKIQRLKPRVEAAQKRETDEMLSKLKGLGNSFLGKFGLSTDNFKFEPNGQGGYSVNFSR